MELKNNIEIRTDEEKARDEKYDKIVELYHELKRTYKGYKPNRYIVKISEMEGVNLSSQSIRIELKKRGII